MTARVFTLVSDFNAEPLARYLRQAQDASELAIEVAPYGQVYQTLETAGAPGWAALVWTLPERMIPGYAQALNGDEPELSGCLAEVDHFADALLRFAQTRTHLFVAAWVPPPGCRGYGLLDWRPGIGLAHLLMSMNLRLAERLAEASNIYMMDAQRWLLAVPQSHSPKMWYAAKVPFSNPVFEHAAYDLAAAFAAVSGRSRKLIVLDLDNTLWGGVVGETGWSGIRLGGHDHVGEAFCDFQRELKALSSRGIQLAIVSKNDEAVALEAIDRHDDMLLRRDRFAGWRINWNDKAANIESLVDELNLGLDAIVFIDDNPAERERVRGALPQVLVPEWPADPCAYTAALRALQCFDVPSVSKEDRMRTGMYVAERERRDSRNAIESADEWLRRLGTRLAVSPVSRSNIARVAQLFNKTNQLNLSTRRLSEQEILDWASEPQRTMLALSASDRFGELGLVGVIGVEADGTQARLVDFLLSCRVMGRKVEEAMLALAAAEARRMGAQCLIARYLQTQRNRPTLDVLRAAGMREEDGHVFGIDCLQPSAGPDAVAIVAEPPAVKP